ncbi:DUF6894 family protein [Bradyrhizobium diazoefficiens]
MPRYFFHITHERTEIDREGEELPDKHAASKETTVTAGQMLQGIGRETGAGPRLADGSDRRVSKHALRSAHSSRESQSDLTGETLNFCRPKV